jgi:hypothetical protein
LPGECRLPAIAAIAPVTAIAATSAATTVATASAATATTTAAVSTATATASAATAAGSFCLWPCFVHYEVAPAKILTVQRIHRAIRILVAIHFDERETARLPRKTITNEIDA